MEITIPGFSVKRLIGKGGMAKVYLAEQEVLEREVALKVMAKSLVEDPTFGKRFLSEAKIVSKLVHPNIVTVHDMGEQDGAYYISMEYIEGEELKNARNKLSLRQKLDVICQIAKALEYAAGKGVVHRDIKPENIMLHADDGRAILMDFGIARGVKTDVRVTQTGVAIGTPHYMSPEQAKGKLVDHRSDIYSLGVVFYYLIAGQVPFDGESAVSIGIKHISEEPPLLPPGYELLQPIITILLAKNADHRYQSAREIIDEIRDLDLAALEHSIEIARANNPLADDVDQNATTFVSDKLESSLHSQPSMDMEDVSGFFETEDHVFGKRNAFWTWLMIFLIAGVAGLYYFEPEFAKPWIQAAEQRLEHLWLIGKNQLSEWGVELN